jgi:hypothetical protein
MDFQFIDGPCHAAGHVDVMRSRRRQRAATRSSRRIGVHAVLGIDCWQRGKPRLRNATPAASSLCGPAKHDLHAARRQGKRRIVHAMRAPESDNTLRDEFAL